MRPSPLWLVLLLALPLVPAVADFPKPEAEITSFRLESLSLRDATFSFELTVSNPYPVDLPIAGLDLDFLVEGTKVFRAENQGKFEIPAKKKKATKFKVVLAYEGIASTVKNYLEKDWLKTVIDGTLDVALPKLPGLPKKISFDFKLTQMIPALKPEVSLLNFSVQGPSENDIEAAIKKSAKKLKLKDVVDALKDVLAGKRKAKPVIKPQDIDVPFTLTYTLVIENKAQAPLGFAALGYSLYVNDESLMTGESAQVTQVGTKTLVTIVNTFRSGQLSDNLQKVFEDRQGRFRVTGNALLQVPAEIRKDPVPLAFDESGNFSF